MKKFFRLILGAVFVAAGASCQTAEDVPVEITEPRLISIVPQTVWSGCTAVISGIGFSEVPEENVVTVDGTIVPVSMATSNRLTVTMPEHDEGKVSVSVKVNDCLAKGELEAAYAELPELVVKVTGISPEKGFAGDPVTIHGENFSSVAAENSVTFGDVPATVQSVIGTTTIQVIAPEHKKGNVDVKVVSGGKTAVAPSQFCYMVFEFTSNYPERGAAGDKVTITGDGFSTEPSENIVKVGEETAVVESATETELIVVMPDNPEGEYTFSVTTGDKTVSGGKFVYSGTWRIEKILSGYSKVQDIVLDEDGSFWITRREGKAFGIYKYNIGDSDLTLLKSSNSNTASETDPLAASFPWGADVGSDGKLYFAAKGLGKVLTCDKDGVVENYEINDLAMSNPMKVLCGEDGALYVLVRASAGKGSVVKVENHQVTKTWALQNATYEFMCFSADERGIFVFPSTAGDIQLIDLVGGSMNKVAGTGTRHSAAASYTDGEPGNPLTATVNQCEGAICASDGTIYFTDCLGKTIRTFKPDADGDYSKGTIETISGVPYDAKVLPYPNGIALAADGKTLYYVENNGTLCKVYYK